MSILECYSSWPFRKTQKRSFDVLRVDVDTLVAQIVYINADLYRQVQTKEILDLRYQKHKEMAVALNKLHDFSNKVGYLSIIIIDTDKKSSTDLFPSSLLYIATNST